MKNIHAHEDWLRLTRHYPVVVIRPGQFVNGHQFNESGVYTVREYPSNFIIVQNADLSKSQRLYVTREFEIVVDIA
jgi:hypothetical protein